MQEKVNYGGELIARGTLARRMQAQGFEARCVDAFAFGSKEVRAEDEADFGAACACGARWLCAIGPVAMPTCPTCEKN